MDFFDSVKKTREIIEMEFLERARPNFPLSYRGEEEAGYRRILFPVKLFD